MEKLLLYIDVKPKMNRDLPQNYIDAINLIKTNENYGIGGEIIINKLDEIQTLYDYLNEVIIKTEIIVAIIKIKHNDCPLIIKHNKFSDYSINDCDMIIIELRKNNTKYYNREKNMCEDTLYNIISKSESINQPMFLIYHLSGNIIQNDFIKNIKQGINIKAVKYALKHHLSMNVINIDQIFLNTFSETRIVQMNDILEMQLINSYSFSENFEIYEYVLPDELLNVELNAVIYKYRHYISKILCDDWFNILKKINFKLFNFGIKMSPHLAGYIQDNNKVIVETLTNINTLDNRYPIIGFKFFGDDFNEEIIHQKHTNILII